MISRGGDWSATRIRCSVFGGCTASIFTPSRAETSATAATIHAMPARRTASSHPPTFPQPDSSLCNLTQSPPLDADAAASSPNSSPCPSLLHPSTALNTTMTTKVKTAYSTSEVEVRELRRPTHQYSPEGHARPAHWTTTKARPMRMPACSHTTTAP